MKIRPGRILMLLAMTACLFLTAACGGTAGPGGKPAGTTTAASPAGTTTAKPGGNGTEPTTVIVPGDTASGKSITVTMPEDWTQVADSAALIQYQKITHSFIVTIEPFTSDTLDGVVAEATGIYGTSFNGFKVTDGPDSLKIAGHDARSLTFTCELSGMDMKFRYFYVFEGDDLYVLSFADLANSFDSLEPEYAVILDSVEFK
ncbi:MAG: hypothetical protein KBA30_03235 [Clostridia bacterium]|nr:hypothetical protein [Clostridia bacterium]